jgi:hypothetical protein
MSKRRASEIWKEIKPFAVRDLVKPDNKTTSGVATGLYFYDTDNVSSHQLPSITTGDYNTMYGVGAGYGLTSGGDNVFIGYQSGYSNTTGGYNIFIGEYAGYSNTTIGMNVFIGYSSGEDNTYGYQNVFVGYNSGRNNTTGGQNTLLGFEAGSYNNTGNYNTFIGNYAGYKNTSGENNIIVGNITGYNTTTGYKNVFLGNAAGYLNTTGYHNVSLGHEAGRSVTTGNSNVFLGYQAGYGETGSNKLYIENSNSTTPLIYGDFDADTVHINGSFSVTPVWKSWDVRPNSVKLPTTNPPAEDTIDAFSFVRFDREIEESIYYVWEVPADYYAGAGSVKGRFEFVVENPPTSVGTNVAENVRMGFEYKKISDGAVFDFDAGTSSGYVDETIAVDETAWIIHQTADVTCTTTGWAVGDTILFRFYRDVTAAEDTYDNEASAADNDVWVFGFRIKYLVDKIGTD